MFLITCTKMFSFIVSCLFNETFSVTCVIYFHTRRFCILSWEERGSDHGLFLATVLSQNLLLGTERNFIQDGHPHGLEFNLACPKYKVAVLTIQSQCFITKFFFVPTVKFSTNYYNTVELGYSDLGCSDTLAIASNIKWY
jgi:hypothetical protein